MGGERAVASVAGDEEGDLFGADGAGVALVVVGVAGEDGVRPDAGGGAGRRRCRRA